MEERTAPEFDYSNYSRADQKRIVEMRMELQYLSVQVDGNAAAMSRAEYETITGKHLALVDKIEAAQLAYVTYVPRDWFVTSAPADVSVKTADWWNWMRVDRLAELKDMALEARKPAAVSGK